MAYQAILTANRPLAPDTTRETANFFKAQLGEENAAAYLKAVLTHFAPEGSNGAAANTTHSNKRSRQEDETSAVDQESFSVDSMVLRDATDSLPMTVILQIPEEITLVSFIIGKGGSNLSLITSMTGCKVTNI